MSSGVLPAYGLVVTFGSLGTDDPVRLGSFGGEGGRTGAPLPVPPPLPPEGFTAPGNDAGGGEEGLATGGFFLHAADSVTATTAIMRIARAFDISALTPVA